MAFREKPTEYLVVFWQLATLCITEDEKRATYYADNLYVSGRSTSASCKPLRM